MIKGLVGEKLGHSYSKLIHEKICTDSYNLYSLTKEEFNLFFEKKEFDFVNVTIPYKQDVIPFLDFISEEASKIGAVNLVVNRNGKLYGYNTDYYGLKYLFDENKISLKNKKCLILGTGGTSKTAEKVLTDLGSDVIYKASRTKKDNALSYDEVYDYDFNIIVNTTPVGMYPDINQNVIDLNKFRNIEFICDCVYNPFRTALLLDAENLQIKNANGLKMLIVQAVKAHEIAFDVKMNEEIIDKIYSELLNENMNIVLIGMPGSGKSTIGKEVAKKLNMKFVDLDTYIEEKNNRTISKIFEDFGEDFFRLKETECCKDTALMKRVVIATGGGVVKKKQNIDLLKSNGIVINIDRNIDMIYNDLKKTLDDGTNYRPLFKNFKSLEKIYNERCELYLSLSDYTVKNNTGYNECVEKIIDIVVRGCDKK